MLRTETKPGHRLMGMGLAAAFAAPGTALAMPDWNLQPPVTPIARQMFEKHGPAAIAQAAQQAVACESRGDAEEAREWRHIEEAMKMMRGPHQS